MRKNVQIILCATALLLMMSSVIGQKRIELGQVKWLRNYDEAIAQAKQTDKPIFILFQEVPGCATCQNFGSDVLSNPFIVEILQNEFVPIAIYNNKKGHDKDILEKYNEPSWNNPVAHITDANGKDIISRLSGEYRLEGVLNYILTGLELSGKSIPNYISLYNSEITAKKNNIEEAYYSMYCFWSGEGILGQLDGLISSEPGFMNGKEVVKLAYDKTQIDHKKLKSITQSNNYKKEEKGKYRSDKDPQYYLKNSPYKYLALTPLQKTKINAALYNKSDASVWLSPSQKAFLSQIAKPENLKVLYHLNFEEAWLLMTSNFKT